MSHENESNRRAQGDSAADSDDIPEVTAVTGTGIPIHGNDIDTDQIIPARFLKAVTFDGLGQFAFFDQRFDEEDNPKEHPMNEEQYQDANIMVVNANFGCGSSREHAPQALKRRGIDALVGENFAEIFAGNCLALGVPTITAEEETVMALQHWVEENPDGTIHIDIEAETVLYGDTEVDVKVSDAQRRALVEGVWDTTALLSLNEEAIQKLAESLPYVDT